MNAEAKTLAALVAAFRNAEYQPGRCPIVPVHIAAFMDVFREALPLLDRLSAPVEGVGLTRYDPDVTPQGNILWEEVAGGDWVKVDDATAALAAKEAVRRKSDEIGAMKAEQYVAERKAHEETKAERDALKAALAPFAEALDEDDFADERLLDRDEIWEHPVAMRITFKHLRDAKRAALSPAQGGE